MTKRGFSGIVLMLLVFCGPAHGQDRLQQLRQELISLRSKVESLHAKLQRKRESFRIKQRSLASQKAELKASLRREQLAVKQLEKALAEQRQAARAAGAVSEALKPVVFDAIRALAQHIKTGLPFKRQQRLLALVELKRSLETGAITSQQAVNRLWGFYQDEYRLTGDTGIHTQVIRVNGEKRLVDVVKVGMMLLYYRTDNGLYGQAALTPEGWRFVAIKDEEARQHIDTLFNSLRKQIRVGYFTLPNKGLARGEER